MKDVQKNRRHSDLVLYSLFVWSYGVARCRTGRNERCFLEKSTVFKPLILINFRIQRLINKGLTQRLVVVLVENGQKMPEISLSNLAGQLAFLTVKEC